MTTRMKLATVLTFTALGLAVLPGAGAWAQQDAAAAMTASERYEANLKRWQGMSEEERREIRAKAAKLPPQKVQELRQKAAQFHALPAQERERIQENYHKFKEMPQAEKKAIQERHARFMALPEPQREKIRTAAREKHVAGEGLWQRRQGPELRRQEDKATSPASARGEAGRPRMPEERSMPSEYRANQTGVKAAHEGQPSLKGAARPGVPSRREGGSRAGEHRQHVPERNGKDRPERKVPEQK